MTFIEIDTVVYIDKDKGYIPCGPAIINTEKIFDITPNQDETAWFIEMGDERHRHIVTAAEWARIAPLLMPAPAEPVAPSPFPAALISAYLRWKTDVADPRAINDILSTLEKCMPLEETDHD